MRFYEFKLVESQGGLIRRSQEVAQGKTVAFSKGDTRIELAGTTVVPSDALAYETFEELDAGLKAAVKGIHVLYYSKLTDKHRAALIVTFTDPTDTKPTKTIYGFVKFVNTLKPGLFPVLWTNSEFTSETGWQLADNKIAERAQFNLKPNALFQTDEYLSPADLPNLIAERTDLPPEVSGQVKQLLSNVVTGARQPVVGADQYMTTYEVDLGESAAPIALVTGNFVSGSYKEAEQALLAPLGLTWQSIQGVLFPGAGSNLLYDSYLQLNKNTSLKVSSKDKKGGAAASVTGLMTEIEKSPERFSSITNDKAYQNILRIVKIVSENSAVMGPLILAEEFQILTAQEVESIREHWGKGEKEDSTGWIDSPGIAAAFAKKGAKTADPAYDIGFHALAGVAELVAVQLNAIPNLDNFFKAVLERSTMVQVKARMQKSGTGASFADFQVIYPPVFTGKIKVVAGNNYMATRRPIGKISFKIG
jgi:hypothetical protein